MHEHHKEVVQRRYYTVNGAELNDDQAEEMIESGASEEIFKKAVLEQGKAHIMETVEEIKERSVNTTANFCVSASDFVFCRYTFIILT